MPCPFNFFGALCYYIHHTRPDPITKRILLKIRLKDFLCGSSPPTLVLSLSLNFSFFSSSAFVVEHIPMDGTSFFFRQRASLLIAVALVVAADAFTSSRRLPL